MINLQLSLAIRLVLCLSDSGHLQLVDQLINNTKSEGDQLTKDSNFEGSVCGRLFENGEMKVCAILFFRCFSNLGTCFSPENTRRPGSRSEKKIQISLSRFT